MTDQPDKLIKTPSTINFLDYRNRLDANQEARMRSSPAVRGVLIPKGLFSRIRHLDPFRIRSSAGGIAIIPVPPLVRRSLRVTLRRVLPNLLPAERGNIEVVPGP